LIRKLRLYYDVCDGHRGTLANKVAEVALARRTPWFVELENDLGITNVQLLQRADMKLRNYVIGDLRKQDAIRQRDRLAVETETTTGTYR